MGQSTVGGARPMGWRRKKVRRRARTCRRGPHATGKLYVGSVRPEKHQRGGSTVRWLRAAAETSNAEDLKSSKLGCGFTTMRGRRRICGGWVGRG
uniref:Uncharacterized protein n=1 Tax=Arundo donax TaxID=35708 RepID=A0A0A9AE45_ARUDO